MIVSLVIMVIILTTVLVPIMSDSQDLKMVNGDGGYAMKLETSPANHTVSYVASTATLTIDGKTYTSPASTTLVIATDAGAASINNAGTISWGDLNSKRYGVISEADYTITTSGGSISITAGEYTYTHSYSWLFIPDTAGSWTTSHLSHSDIYFRNNEDLYFAFYNNIVYMSFAHGVLTNTSGNDQYSYDKTEVADGVYRLGDNHFANLSTNVDMWIVPKVIPYTTGGTLNAILSVIPILIAVGIMITATAYIVRSRSD